MNLTQLAELIGNRPFILQNQHIEEVPFEQLFKLPYTIDLSNNILSGPIWPEFGDLKTLQIFDLSWNNISGSIPPNLSETSSLEKVDFSHNALTGEIPSALTKLHSLSNFTVSYNRLRGRIPEAGQFSTFPDSSFEGNLGLCGEFVLPCRDDDHKPTDPNATENDEEEGNRIFGIPFSIGMSMGFVLTVWVCMFSKKLGPRREQSQLLSNTPASF